LKRVNPSRFRFIQAAQFTGQMRFLQRSAGATDGWAQKVISHGWSIQHRLRPPYDYNPGKRYTLYVRVRAKATDPTQDGLAMQTGFYVKGSLGARGLGHGSSRRYLEDRQLRGICGPARGRQFLCMPG